MATRLIQSFHERHINVELVLVDNGSHDRTGAIIDALVAEGCPVVKVSVAVNQGYGHGVLQGLQVCRGNLVGFMCADEQVDPYDVVKLYEIAVKAQTPRLFKVRRRFRMEGPLRRLVSITYNLLATILFGGLDTMDINANPKILPRSYLQRMQLQAKDWFVDAEVVIKARRMGLSIFEMNHFAQMRAEGASHVRPTTCWEFIVNLWSYRFGSKKHLLTIQPDMPEVSSVSARNVES
jgi:glycosyltransferase involved in cell wall biosynthesis